MCVCGGNMQATGQFSRKQNRLRQVGTGRDGAGREGGYTGWYATKRYSTDRTGRKRTVLGTGQATSDGSGPLATEKWRNGERIPKLTGTQRRNHEFHFKLWHAVMYYCGNYKYVWYKWYSVYCTARCWEMRGLYIHIYYLYISLQRCRQMRCSAFDMLTKLIM